MTERQKLVSAIMLINEMATANNLILDVLADIGIQKESHRKNLKEAESIMNKVVLKLQFLE